MHVHGFPANQSQVLIQEAPHRQGVASLTNKLLKMGSNKTYRGLQILAAKERGTRPNQNEKLGKAVKQRRRRQRARGGQGQGARPAELPKPPPLQNNQPHSLPPRVRWYRGTLSPPNPWPFPSTPMAS